MKYLILIASMVLFCSCSTMRGYKKNDKRINIPQKASVENKFIRYADEKIDKQKQIFTPEGFTKWTLFSGTFSFLLFQFLKWKHVV